MAEANSLNNTDTNNDGTTKEEPKPDNYLFVVALDFGTTYSGYAFSSRNDFTENPLKISENPEWKADGSPLISLKTPTSILLRKDGSFVAFGYDAEDIFYSEMEEHKDDMLFRRFKMKLYDKMVINESMTIEDVAGRSFPAKSIFTSSIKALVDHFKKSFGKQNVSNLTDNDIKWVLTVPAIWSDAAKKFMRLCATDAGIPNQMLQIALEPEAASIYGQYLPVERNENGFGMTKEGTKYMVVDIGGGTADITVHEKVKEGRLRELHQATGGACGGTAVDAAFENRLTEILGENIMKTLREKKTETYLDIFREFEIAKRAIIQNKTGYIRMTISVVTLGAICQEIENKTLEEAFTGVEGMYIKGDKLHINVETMKKFFESPTKDLIQHMQALFEDPRTCGISLILLVGGSANSEYIQSEIEKAFTSVKLVIPPEAGLAVLKGAVIYGHCPTIIKSRILRFTYGTDVCPPFDPAKHKEDKKIKVGVIDRCKGCFSPIVIAGTEIDVGEKKIETYETTSKHQFQALVQIFCSPCKEVKYTDDEKCFKLGEVNIPLPGNFLAGLLGIEEIIPFVVIYIFGGTELQVQAIDLITKGVTSCTMIMKENEN